MTTLHDAYIAGDPAVRSLFNAPPEQVCSLAGDAPAWPTGMADALTAYQRGIGATRAPIEGREWVIATGQQPGLFTGPLYTIYKGITALKIASDIAGQGVPCVPLFWNAGDDHDFEEVRTAHFLTRRHELRSLGHTPRDETGKELDITALPMYRAPVDAALHTLIDAAAEACPGSEQGPAVRALLHETLTKARSIAEWFSLVMARLFADTPLHLFVPHIHAARVAALPILRREIAQPLASTELLQGQGARIESLGYERPIQRDDDACNFFLEVGGRRRKVFYRKGRYVIPVEELSCTRAELLALLEAAPERFSPNVALRPVIQQHLFPVAAYVAGPGEVAYWAQLKSVFAFFETSMPIVYPRLRCTLYPLKARRIMERYCLTMEDVIADRDILARALRHEGGNPALEALETHRPHVEDALDALVRAVSVQADNNAFGKAAARFEARTRKGLEKFERELLHADTQKRRAVEARIARLHNTIAPFGKPQERVLSVFSFLFEHGLPLIQRMINELDAKTFAAQTMEL